MVPAMATDRGLSVLRVSFAIIEARSTRSHCARLGEINLKKAPTKSTPTMLIRTPVEGFEQLKCYSISQFSTFNQLSKEISLQKTVTC